MGEMPLGMQAAWILALLSNKHELLGNVPIEAIKTQFPLLQNGSKKNVSITQLMGETNELMDKNTI